ncbi:MAG: SPOR domain-containing protein [Propionibacteriaceae bacterium]
MAEGQWWYNTATKAVESDDAASKAVDRLGPYATREEAEHAMEKVAERNEAWDNDPKWNDD